jgi:hypothetical protein
LCAIMLDLIAIVICMLYYIVWCVIQPPICMFYVVAGRTGV